MSVLPRDLQRSIDLYESHDRIKVALAPNKGCQKRSDRRGPTGGFLTESVGAKTARETISFRLNSRTKSQSTSKAGHRVVLFSPLLFLLFLFLQGRKRRGGCKSSPPVDTRGKRCADVKDFRQQIFKLKIAPVFDLQNPQFCTDFKTKGIPPKGLSLGPFEQWPAMSV